MTNLFVRRMLSEKKYKLLLNSQAEYSISFTETEG